MISFSSNNDAIEDVDEPIGIVISTFSLLDGSTGSNADLIYIYPEKPPITIIRIRATIIIETTLRTVLASLLRFIILFRYVFLLDILHPSLHSLHYTKNFKINLL